MVINIEKWRYKHYMDICHKAVCIACFKPCLNRRAGWQQSKSQDRRGEKCTSCFTHGLVLFSLAVWFSFGTKIYLKNEIKKNKSLSQNTLLSERLHHRVTEVLNCDFERFFLSFHMWRMWSESSNNTLCVHLTKCDLTLWKWVMNLLLQTH